MQLELTKTQAALVRLAISDFLFNNSQDCFSKHDFEDLQKVQDDISDKFQKLLIEELI